MKTARATRHPSLSRKEKTASHVLRVRKPTLVATVAEGRGGNLESCFDRFDDGGEVREISRFPLRMYLLSIDADFENAAT